MNNTNLKLHEKRIDELFIDNPDYHAIQTEYHFVYDYMVKPLGSRGSYLILRHRKKIGINQASWRTFSANGMKWWEENTNNKEKKKIIEDMKDWFDMNNLPWEDVDAD